ncbi:MAG: hypothetical protein AB1846_13495 [Chloroflexota bacterium]
MLFFASPACAPSATSQPSPTPDTYLAEELAYQAIATAKAKKTEIASRDLHYAGLSGGNRTTLAFWFEWNGETLLLPLSGINAANTDLVVCRMESDAGMVIGRLVPGFEIEQGLCAADEAAAGNALPLVKIPGYFEDGIETVPDGRNVIDLDGEFAGNLAEVITFVVQNDLLGSGDLTLTLRRAACLEGQANALEADAAYFLPAGKLQLTFPDDRLENFEYVEDAVHALEREFTWSLPEGLEGLDLSAGDDNWFLLRIVEMDPENEQEEHIIEACIQVTGVGVAP